ncbi:MAG: S8 family serine peptidase [Bacteroidia bacterium]|nr:S8 family serine peptidase [Bacteroidia bacterium]
MKIIISILIVLVSYANLNAQSNYYWVYLKQNISVSNTPIANCFDNFKSENLEIIGISKWFNAVYVKIDDTNILEEIIKLKEVCKVEKSREYKKNINSVSNDSSAFIYTKKQLSMLGLDKYHQKGYTGKNITLALFDGGFYKVDSIVAFDSLRKRNGIKACRDFVSNNNNVYNDDAHGMYVLSIISGYIKDSMIGAAPDVNFLLARTEDVSTEKHIEEFNWIRALEWADSIGVDIIHSSLGYSVFDSLQGDYKYSDMNGESTIITRAAQMAYKRGIFITNSAGNEGEKSWKHIIAPCDGKDVLCVGSVDENMKKSGFSSFGPSADGRVKPDVMAMGSNVTIIGTNNIIRKGSGTSFSGPLIAGMIACLKQKFPTVPNQIILDAVRKSCHLYSNYNDSMGYGIPDVNKADSLINIKLAIADFKSKKDELTVFPNPFKTEFEIKGNIKIKEVEILDIYGKKVMNIKNTNKINFDTECSETYILKITDSNKIIHFKRIVKIDE